MFSIFLFVIIFRFANTSNIFNILFPDSKRSLKSGSIMYPKWHILYGAIFSVLVLLIFPSVGLLSTAIILLSSVLIDVDHYIFYVHRYKDKSLKHAYKWFSERGKTLRRLDLEKREKFEQTLLIFHGIECWIIIAAMMLLSRLFFFVLIGFLFHVILDLVDLYLNNDPVYHKLSQIYTYKRNKNKRRYD